MSRDPTTITHLAAPQSAEDGSSLFRAVINEGRSFCSSQKHNLHQLHLSRGDARQKHGRAEPRGGGQRARRGPGCREGAGMWERCCPRGSAAPRAPGRLAHREPSHSRALSLSPSRSTQRSGLGRLPSSSLPAAPRPETTPRGTAVRPHSRTPKALLRSRRLRAVPRAAAARAAPSPPPRGRAGLAAPRPLPTTPRKRNRDQSRPEGWGSGGSGAQNGRADPAPGLSVPARGNAARSAHLERRPVLRSEIAEARRCHGCSARGWRCGGHIAPATDRPARETFTPRPPAPPRPREEPAEPRARGSRSTPGPRRPRVRPPPPASPTRTGCSRLPPPPPTSRCPPTCPRSAGIIPGAGGAGRGQLLARQLCAAPRCGRERGTRGAPALPRGGGRLYPPGRAVPPLRGAATSFPAPGRRSRTAAGLGVMAPPGGRAEQRHAGGGGPGAGAAERGYGRRRDRRPVVLRVLCMEGREGQERWEVCYRQELHLARARGVDDAEVEQKLQVQCRRCAGTRTAVTALLRSSLCCSSCTKRQRACAEGNELYRGLLKNLISRRPAEHTAIRPCFPNVPHFPVF